MRKHVAAVAAALALIGSPALIPASASASTPLSVSAAAKQYVKVPKAKPGQFCKTAHKGKFTKTASGTLRCVKVDARYRWKRV